MKEAQTTKQNREETKKDVTVHKTNKRERQREKKMDYY